MRVDISDLDLLPETNPIAVSRDLDDQGLADCQQTCGVTCFGRTCGWTENKG